MNLAVVHAYIDEHFDEHLSRTQAFVRQPSISADGTGMRKMADLVIDQIQRLGGEAEEIATSGYPAIYGHIDAGARRTLLIYGMYDVQPVAGEDWIVPPFSGEIVNLEPFGACVVSRGIMNSKGPLIGTLNALESIRQAAGAYPVNIKFLVEGEEEMGSAHLPAAVARYRDKLQADGVFFPFYSQDITGKVIMSLGVKGLVFLEMVVQGADWGGPSYRNIHASHASWVASPTITLIQAIASMLSPNQCQLLIDGLLDDVRVPTDEDEMLLAKLAPTFQEESVRRELGVLRFKHDLTGVDLLRRYLFDPSLNVDGIAAGHVSGGTKTVLAREARAKLHIRLVPEMSPEDIVSRVREHMDRHGFAQVEMHAHTAYPSAKGRVSDLVNRAMIQTYRSFDFEPEIWPLRAGAAPLYLFTKELGLPFVIGGLGHGGGQHSPNEYATVEGIRLYEKSAAAFLYDFAALS